MIRVTNDWVLKTLPNADVSTESSYTNDVSKDLFPFLVRLKSGDRGVEKFLTSSTGLDIPTYQPDPADVAYNNQELAYNRMGRNIDTYCAYSIQKSNLGGSTFVQRLRTNPDGDDYGFENLVKFRWRGAYDPSTSSYEYKDIKFKFFNPVTCDYDKTLVLGAKYESQKYYYVSGRRTKRQYQQRWNLYWFNENDPTELYPAHQEYDSHINIMPGDDARVIGDGLTAIPYLYFYTDIGFDPINEKWVGLLNLFGRPNGTGLQYFTGDDVPGTPPSGRRYEFNAYSFWRYMGRNVYQGPYSGIQGGYQQALGTALPLNYIFYRAFELDSQPNIPVEQRTDNLTKLGCYGPTTRVIV